MKVCRKCTLIKPISEFNKAKGNLDGLNRKCKMCVSDYDKLYYANNKDKRNKQSKEWYKDNQDKIVTYRKEYYEEHRDPLLLYSKKYREKNEPELRVKRQEYYQENKHIIIPKNYQRKKKKLNEDPLFRLTENLRNRTNAALKGLYKTGSAVEELGCSGEELKIHIESLWQPGMTWENYGYYGWHLDHRLPLKSFDLADKEQFKKATHYTNLQPMWAHENMGSKKKNDYKVINEFKNSKRATKEAS